MNDPQNSDRDEREPQAPKFMRPRRPVLDEPLDGEPEAFQEEPESGKTLPEERLEGKPSEIEPTQEFQPASEPVTEVEPEGGEPKPASPYFPHGIYEDAQSVEAYYGRGESEKDIAKLTVQETYEGDARPHPLLRWWFAALAILLILALLLLVLTKGIPLNLY